MFRPLISIPNDAMQSYGNIEVSIGKYGGLNKIGCILWIILRSSLEILEILISSLTHKGVDEGVGVGVLCRLSILKYAN